MRRTDIRVSITGGDTAMTTEVTMEELRQALDHARIEVVNIAYSRHIPSEEREKLLRLARIAADQAWKAWRAGYAEDMAVADGVSAAA